MDDLFHFDNNYFDGLISQICPSEPPLNKVNSSETKAPILDLHLSILEWFISCKIYDKHEDFDFNISNIPYLDGYVPRRAPYCVYVSQLIWFARVSSHVTD